MTRREFVQASSVTSAALLTGCAPRRGHAPAVASLAPYDAVPPIALIRAHADRIFRTTVCLRPFRAQGPRVEVERVGDKIVVHNYGHGGSGWSLSWGSATLAMELAAGAAGASLAGKEVAVVGCGALGLTLATLLQRAGARVTILCKDRATDTRSFRATGAWTPDSRVALTKAATPAFGDQWERMARTSWRTYQGFYALPGDPVEFVDRYALSDLTPEQAEQKHRNDDPIGFAYLNYRLADFMPHAIDLPPGTHPFPTRYARRREQLMFNITTLVHTLTEDFLVAGGRMETREFHSPGELGALAQDVVFNCTGYGARALFQDESIIPVRGQIAWLIPQVECRYGILLGDLNILARRDGIVVQLSEQGEATGWNDTNEAPDAREAAEGVRRLQALYDRSRTVRG